MRLIVIIAIGLSLYLYFKGKDAGKNGKNNASPIIGKTLFEEGKASGYSAKQNAAGLVTYPKEFWKQDVVKIDTAGKTPKQIIDDAISRLNKEDEDRPEKAKIYIQRESGTNIKIFFTRFLIHKSSLGLENGRYRTDVIYILGFDGLVSIEYRHGRAIKKESDFKNPEKVKVVSPSNVTIMSMGGMITDYTAMSEVIRALGYK